MAAWGQGGEFNPSNPAEPGQMYFLTVNVTPEGAGSVSSPGKNQYALGQRIDLWASATTNYRFVGWRQGTAPVSDLASFSYTIPAAHTTLTAVFEYVPGNPEEPSPVPLQHTLFLSASPAEGGRFNVSSGSLFKEGDVIGLQAYLNSGYEFEGWKRGDEIVSTNPSYSVTMGTEDISLVGLFRFDPGSPSNPGANHWDAVSGEVIVDDFAAGNLMGAIDDVIGGSGNRNKVVAITVAGAVSSGDLGVARYYSACMSLDLKRISGISSLPSYAFDKSQLQKISLPAEITSIGSCAFRNCVNLSEINCYSMVPPALDQNVFEGTSENVVLRVPQTAIPQYNAAAQWNQLTILPLMEEIGSLSVTLPEVASDGRYKNMTLELVNTKSAQKLRFVITDKLKYVFGGLITGDVYNLYLKNTSGVILGEVRELVVTEEGMDAVFNSILSLYDLSLKVVTEKGVDVSDEVVVKWYDADTKFLSQGNVLKQQLAGNKIRYTIELDRVLGSKYLFPESKEHTVSEKGNTLVYTLQPIDSLDIQGIVKGDDGSLISGAVVSVSQLLNGKYSRSVIGKTDKNGKFVLNVYNDVTTITFSANGYINKTVSCPNFNAGGELDAVQLPVISGATITLDFTYTPSVAAGETPQPQMGYANYQNVAYTLYNKTKAKAVKDFSVQYPSIVLMEPTDVGDEIQITASSRGDDFKPVECTVTIDAENGATAQLNIVQLGRVKVSYTDSENETNVVILYDSKGQRLKSFSYDKEHTVIFAGLSDGVYTLVSMAYNRLLNSILNLSGLPAAGLTENADYVKSVVNVVSGKVEEVVLQEIPKIDQTRFSYTDSSSYIRTNKATIVAGNYLTIRSQVGFKEEYANQVNNVKLVVELPESCSFVNNSIMIGNKVVNEYTIDGTSLSIPLADYSEQVRFCIIPTKGETITPNGFVEFDYNGETLKQPFGVANCLVKDLSIMVPRTMAKTKLPISGIAPGYSTVKVYDNEVLIGQATALANGTWVAQGELYDAYNLSKHTIYALVETPQNTSIKTQSQVVTYNRSAIEVQKVTMINTAHPSSSLDLCEYIVEFDFQNPKSEMPVYWYWPNYPDFTFKIDFTNNSPQFVSDVTLYITTSAGSIVSVPASYDKEKDIWLATRKFYSNALPTNLSVDYKAETKTELDRSYIDECYTWINELEEEDSNNSPIPTDIEDDGRYDGLNDEQFLISVSECAEKMESLADIHDIDPALDEISDLGGYDYADADGNSGSVIVENCENIVEGNLETEGFIKQQLTDAGNLYIKTTGGEYTLVDFNRNLHLSIKKSLPESLSAAPALRMSDPFLNPFLGDINALTGLALEMDKLSGFIIKFIRDHLNVLNKEMAVVRDEYVECYKAVSKSKIRVAECTDIVLKEQLELATAKLEGQLILRENKLNRYARAIERWKGTFSKVSTIISVITDVDKGVRAGMDWGAIVSGIRATKCPNMDKLENRAIMYGSTVLGLYITAATSNLLGLESFAKKLGISSVWSLVIVDISIYSSLIAEYSDMIWQHEIRMAMPGLKCDDDDDDDDPGGGDDNPGGDDDNPGGGDNPGGDDNPGGSGKPDDSDHPGGDGSPSNNPTNPNGGGSASGGIGNGGGKSGQSGSSDPGYVLDPSGYVYEAVPSNRLQGVTTTVYQKTYEEDMYGDLHEKIVLWNAKDYAQENPLTTDENGMYAWDVPAGQWQVKYEKEGYQTAYSEWLPVPPPQLDVNIGLVQNTQPYVTIVRGYETGIEVTFSKFMQPSTLTTEQVLVTRNGVAENGEVQLLNTEPDPLKGNEMFASKVRFIPEQPFAITDKVVLTVSRRAKSYADIGMESDFSQEVSIEKEAKSIATAPNVEVVYNRVAEITIAVEPVEAAAGKKITALSASPSIATLDISEAVLDENGEAVFTVRGELLGSTVLQFVVEGMTLRTEVKVKVVKKGEGEVIRNYHLAMGWNWLTVNVADQRINDVVTLLEPIKESVVALKGQEGELTKDDQGNWQGDLSLLHPTRSYKIEMLQDDDLELKGKPVLPADATITLNKGWNWIGYISAEEVSVESALQNLTAEENDVIKGLDCFAVYNGTTWAGSLTHLVPGEGYMYYSQSVKSFNYVEPETEDVTPDAFSPQWKYDARQYADNMTVLARLYNGEQQVEADKYLIGAFSGNECRGVAVEKEGHIFLTVHGEQAGEQISLRAFDVASGKEYMIKEELDFSSDVMKGSYASPESLHLGDPTGIHNIGTGMFIYPNPVRDRLYVRGEVDNIEDIRVVSTAGQTCIVTDRLSAEEGIDVSSLSKGIYFIVVKSVTDEIRQKFIKIE